MRHGIFFSVTEEISMKIYPKIINLCQVESTAPLCEPLEPE
jgi:hypothetical protein